MRKHPELTAPNLPLEGRSAIGARSVTEPGGGIGSAGEKSPVAHGYAPTPTRTCGTTSPQGGGANSTAAALSRAQIRIHTPAIPTTYPQTPPHFIPTLISCATLVSPFARSDVSGLRSPARRQAVVFCARLFRNFAQKGPGKRHHGCPVPLSGTAGAGLEAGRFPASGGPGGLKGSDDPGGLREGRVRRRVPNDNDRPNARVVRPDPGEPSRPEGVRTGHRRGAPTRAKANTTLSITGRVLVCAPHFG